MPPGCATPSACRCPWAYRWPSSSRSRIRWATSSRATPAPTGPFTAAEAAARLGLGVAVVGTALKRLAADGRVVEGEFRPHASPPPARCERAAKKPTALRPRAPVQPAAFPAPAAGRCQRMVRRRSPAQAPPPFAGRAAGRGRAGGRRRLRPVPSGLAERPRPGQARPVGAARTGRDHHRRRPALRRADSGLGLGAPGPRQPGARTTSPPCWTSSWPPAKSSGPAPARSPATTAGSACTWPTPPN